MPYKNKAERRAYLRRWYATNRERLRAKSAERARTQNARQRERYANDPQYRATIRAQQKLYANRHATDAVARAAAWRKANPEKYREHMRRHKEANADAIRTYRRAYYARNRNRAITAAVEYQRAHREKANVNRAQYRARLMRAEGSYTLTQWIEKCELFAWCCAYCGETRTLGPDHKVPLSRGGSNDITNIVPACRSCNSGKRDRTAAEYLAIPRVA